MVFSERITGNSVPLLEAGRQQPDSLILMDEWMDIYNQDDELLQAALRCLDGSVPVLGMLASNQQLPYFIKNHPHLRVIKLTQDNRDSIIDQVVQLLAEPMPKGRMMTEALVQWRLNGSPQPALLCSPVYIEALLTGMLTSSQSISDPHDITVTQTGDVWLVDTTAPVRRLPLEERLALLPDCNSEFCCRVADVFTEMEHLMAMDNSSGLHTVVLSIGSERIVCRDIGRHNAFDKAIGMALKKNLPLEKAVMCTSGRISIEILAKAAAVGIPVLCTCKQVGTIAEQTASRLHIAIVQAGKEKTIYGAVQRVQTH